MTNSTESMKRKTRDKDFTHGYICCLANIVNSHGACVRTVEAYRALGSPSLTELRPLKLSDYDKIGIKQIREYMK